MPAFGVSLPRKKRTLTSAIDNEETQPTTKAQKIHPFFSKHETSDSAFQWKKSLGAKRTCLHGVHLSPESRPKVAAFDLDGTVIKANLGKRTKETATQWEWWRDCVPNKLRELSNSGYTVVFISNQALKSQQIDLWNLKIPSIAAKLSDVPFHIFAATAKDGFRKPMPGMWDELERIFGEDSMQIDKSASFFVGDAAGRSVDFASTDRKWAENLNIPFHTPEQFFLDLPATPYVLPGFRVSDVPEGITGQEIVIFVGYPCLGKTTLYHQHFASAGYVHINQDTLKTRAKCVKAAEEAIQSGKSCVIDNTNRDKATRKFYVQLAAKLNVPIRCCTFSGSIELAWHNNLYRAFAAIPKSDTEAKRDLVPYLAFLSFKEAYEEPELGEGFSRIDTVNWAFEGNDAERKRWSMWLQIDGK
ncbi:PNK3P-domain-containing protein [Coniophora puteana RWD-64-598 SS2]|uniref:PNK3P-domain-containing protein n=1 Tax=Coniophora puteana (strain RWD-64-598) TaxID=741705 RepID=A0A5M3N1Q7_CONPW|nr:PNK3P-domain-containing protein [Coniophora puteana RWD-64-598 SS2]EIW85323.1 PNK3P-domain-containing protein [Coniophora puteana RWD-64-598 SS2]